MNKFPLSGLVILILMIGFTLSANAQTKEEIQKKYISFLHSQKLFSKIDSDGDVQFQYEGKTFFLGVEEDDPTFFRLVLANIWPIESEAERIQVMRAMDVANNKVKVAKIYMVDDNVWVAVEGFQDEPEDYQAYFERSLKVILQCIGYYTEAMKGG